MLEVLVQVSETIDTYIVDVIDVRGSTPDDEPNNNYNSELRVELNEIIDDEISNVVSSRVSKLVSHLTEKYFMYSWRVIVLNDGIEVNRIECKVVGESSQSVQEEPAPIERRSRFDRDDVI